MIFLQWEQMVGLKQPPKSQTRRPVKDNEYGVFLKPFDYANFSAVSYKGSHQRKWQIGKAYAVQPGRGKKAVGRTPPIKSIRRERLGDISEADCIAEGVEKMPVATLAGSDVMVVLYRCPVCWERRLMAQDAYACLWNHIYGKGAWERMKDDDVWVLEFEVASG